MFAYMAEWSEIPGVWFSFLTKKTDFWYLEKKNYSRKLRVSLDILPSVLDSVLILILVNDLA